MITVASENLTNNKTFGVKKSTALFITIKELPQIIAANVSSNEPFNLSLTILTSIHTYLF